MVFYNVLCETNVALKIFNIIISKKMVKKKQNIVI